MPKLRVHNVTVSLDGFAAGTDQRMDAPFGDGIDDSLHDWMFAAMKDHADGKQGTDVDFVARSEDNIGATIMGRNMFGPCRGPWENEAWTGWWGDNPPFHHPVFVHTHHTRPSVSMKGGTDFHFTDEPVETVLARAYEAADGKDVRIGGGPATIQQYLRAGLVDELHLAIAPILVGNGERLLDNLGDGVDGYEVVELVSSPAVTHACLVRRAQSGR
ncbi:MULTISPECIES: dihydrofolate reductase family protein [unclassified Streptomyces]|uniref:dihydrofolate reductase family protein n=1 Tax=unclassified Streptomyces TaxID=2593676 RepID=UPI00224DEE8F|nr:dihydrofolate reductase family protein [Streptomyces sp. NBC_00401]MCX5084696.1 dihydrofolate reductase family protein [Streptomyces sp. NBC_00401]